VHISIDTSSDELIEMRLTEEELVEHVISTLDDKGEKDLVGYNVSVIVHPQQVLEDIQKGKL
jgi:hypothetical protein